MGRHYARRDGAPMTTPTKYDLGRQRTGENGKTLTLSECPTCAAPRWVDADAELLARLAGESYRPGCWNCDATWTTIGRQRTGENNR